MDPPKLLGKLCFLSAPFNTEFLGYGGEPTSLLYALAVVVDEIRRGKIGSLRVEDISVISFRSAAAMDLAALQESILRCPPRVFGISNMTPSSENARHIVEGVRSVNPNMITIFGGPHEDEMSEPHMRLNLPPRSKPTALTHPHLADFSVSGDGEYALSFLISEIEMAGPTMPAKVIKQQLIAKQPEIGQLPGIGTISFICDNEEYRIGLSGRPLNLDTLPFMPRDLLDDRHSRSFSVFRGSGRNLRTAQLMTSRGCFWTCAFCTEATGSTLQRSFENVRREIEQLRDLGYGAIFFDDSTFTNLVNAQNRRGLEGVARRAFLRELLQYLRAEGWNWGCETRIDQIDMPTLRQLKESGCSYIYFGVESVNDGILRDMHKGQRRNRIQDSLDAVEEVGIRVGLSLMFCAPDMARNVTNESRETFEDTITFFKERVARGHICTISTNIATYYPGSEMTHRAIKGGVKIDFLKPTPNVGYPWNRFEDGQGYHPPNVTKSFVEDIAGLTARRLAPYLLKGNIGAIADERLTEFSHRSDDLINLNFPFEFSGSVSSRLSSEESAVADAQSQRQWEMFDHGRVCLGALCGLNESDARNYVIFTRTPNEAIAVSLAATGYYGGPFNAIVPDIDLTTIAAPFQFSGDHGDVCGEDFHSRALLTLSLQNARKRRMPLRTTGASVSLLGSFSDEFELLGRIKRLLTGSKDVVLLLHVDPSTGRILDVHMLCAELRLESEDDELLIIVDGRLAGGVMPRDWSVEDAECDYYVVSPLESLGLLGPCGLVFCGNRRGRELAAFQQRIPLVEGMFPPQFEIKVSSSEEFPVILVQSLLDSFGGAGSREETLLRVDAIAQHRHKMKRHLIDLLSEQLAPDILSPCKPDFADSILSVRFPRIDQFGLVEYMWREQQVLASYFCGRDVIRFAIDLSIDAGNLEKAVNRIARILPRFHMSGQLPTKALDF